MIRPCKNFCGFLVLIIATTTAHAAVNISEINVNDLRDSVVSNLPEGVTLPPELSNIDLGENVNKLSDTFKKKCVENSGSDAAYEEATQAMGKLSECLTEIIDISKLQEEIEEARPNGNLDTVFNSYCDKRGNALVCVENFTKSLDPCLTQEEKDQKTVFVSMARSLLEFVCHENGNQIALFIAEEGPECFEKMRPQLIECANKTLGKYGNMETPSLESLPTMVIKEENCVDMDLLEECVVYELEQCKETTPANLVEALFRFVRKETPCKKKSTVAKAGHHNSGGTTANFPMTVLLGTWIMAVSAKFLLSYQ